MLSSLVVIVVPAEGLKAIGQDIARWFNLLVNGLADFFSISPSLVKAIIMIMVAIWLLVIVVKAFLAIIKGGSDVEV